MPPVSTTDTTVTQSISASTSGNPTFSQNNVFEAPFPAEFKTFTKVDLIATGYKCDAITGKKEGPLLIVESVNMTTQKLSFEVWDAAGNPYSSMSGPGWAAKKACLKYLAVGRE